MQKDTFLKIVIIALLLINAGTLVFLFLHSGGHERGFPPPPGRGPGDFLEHELAMNDSQKEIFRHLREEHHEGMMQYQEQIHDLRLQLFDGLKQGQPLNENLLNQIAARQRSMDSLTYDHFTRLKKTLNPAQKDKFNHVIDDAMRMLGPPPPGR
jgi:hypothetical protein